VQFRIDLVEVALDAQAGATVHLVQSHSLFSEPGGVRDRLDAGCGPLVLRVRHREQAAAGVLVLVVCLSGVQLGVHELFRFHLLAGGAGDEAKLDGLAQLEPAPGVGVRLEGQGLAGVADKRAPGPGRPRAR